MSTVILAVSNIGYVFKDPTDKWLDAFIGLCSRWQVLPFIQFWTQKCGSRVEEALPPHLLEDPHNKIKLSELERSPGHPVGAKNMVLAEVSYLIQHPGQRQTDYLGAQTLPKGPRPLRGSMTGSCRICSWDLLRDIHLWIHYSSLLCSAAGLTGCWGSQHRYVWGWGEDHYQDRQWKQWEVCPLTCHNWPHPLFVNTLHADHGASHTTPQSSTKLPRSFTVTPILSRAWRNPEGWKGEPRQEERGGGEGGTIQSTWKLQRGNLISSYFFWRIVHGEKFRGEKPSERSQRLL